MVILEAVGTSSYGPGLPSECLVVEAWVSD